MRTLCVAALGFATLLTGCGDPPEEDTHGFVKILFGRSDSEADSPYIGTAEVTIQMAYEGCYQNFYAANPGYRIDGVDGAPIFGTLEDGGEGWRDRLCEEDVGGRAECSVVEIQQLLDQASRLTVRYSISGPLENRQLLFGPLPLADLANCDAGLTNTVRLELGGTLGVNGNSEQVWSISSVDGTGVAVPGDGASLRVSAAGN